MTYPYASLPAFPAFPDEETLGEARRRMFHWRSMDHEDPLPSFLAEIDAVLALAAPAVDRVCVLVNGPAVADQMADLGYDAIDGERLKQWVGRWGEMEGVEWFEGSCTATAALVKRSREAQIDVSTPTHTGAARGSDYRGLDVAIAVAALTRVSEFDTVMLVPGDGDMEPLITALLRLNKRVMVVVGKQEVAFEVEERLRVEDVLSLADMLAAVGLHMEPHPREE